MADPNDNDVAGLDQLDDQAYTDSGDTPLTNYGPSATTDVSSSPSDYSQSSDGTVFDKLGNAIGKLATGQTLASLVAAYSTAKTAASTAQNTALLQNAAVTNLQQLAASLAASNAAPDLLQYVQSTMKAVQQGQVPAGQALAAVQQQTQLKGITIPKEDSDAISNTLAGLNQIAKEGYSPIERAAINKALNQVETQTRGDDAQITNQAQEQGQYGSGSQLVHQAMEQQQEANTAAQNGLDIEGQGMSRALAAMTAGGQLGVQAGQQSLGEQNTIGSAADAINANNAQLAQQAAQQNAARAQAAASTNIANDQTIQGQNIAQSNLEQQNKVTAAQNQFSDQNATNTLEDNTAAAAGKDAASMYDANLKASQTAAAAKQATTAAAATPTASGGTDWTKIGTSLLGSYLSSDERVKTNKKELSDDDLDNFFSSLTPNSFEYKKSQQQAVGAPSGPMMGVMAQDVEKTPVGATLVIDTPHGKQIDADKALSMALAAIASMTPRIKALEAK